MKELEELGLTGARQDKNGDVYGSLPVESLKMASQLIVKIVENKSS